MSDTARSNETPIRAFADWQLFSDMKAEDYMTEAFYDAKRDGLIDEGKILATSVGPFGLQYIVFQVDLKLSITNANAVERDVRHILNKVVSDSDVDVRWVAQQPNN